MALVQIVLIVFLIFALSRVLLRFRGGQIKVGEFLFWSLLFIFAGLVVLVPTETTKLANLVGIGRGVDLVIYASIAALFYLLFRAYVMMEDIRHEITELVRKMALGKHRNNRRK